MWFKTSRSKKYCLSSKIEVPEVDGLNYQEALDVLEEAGLLATVVGDSSGRIVKQIPRKGEFVDPNTPVELTFEDWFNFI